MTIKEHLLKSVKIGLAWGSGIAIALMIIMTVALWFELVFDGTSWRYDDKIELRCYQTLEKEQCEKLFNITNINN